MWHRAAQLVFRTLLRSPATNALGSEAACASTTTSSTTWSATGLSGQLRMLAGTGVRGVAQHAARRTPAPFQQSMRTAWTDSRGVTHFGDPAGGAGSRFGLSTRGKVIIGGTLAAGAFYYYSSLETVPFTGRRHAILFVTQDAEKQMGKQLFDQQCMEARMQHALLPPNHPYSLAVRRIGARLAKVAGSGQGGGTYGHMQGLDWEYAVIKSDVPNAFVVPGGKVVVFTGLVDMLSSEEELAAVMAHETAHVLARHHAERMSTLNTFAILKIVVYALFGIGLPSSALYLGIFLPYSRRAEYEADSIGLRLMAAACYDPEAATTMLEKLHRKERAMEKSTGGWVPGFLRTHPLTDTRVEKVKEELPEAYKVYKESGCAQAAGFLSLFV